MSNCLFCKIIKKEIASDIVYEDDLITAFRDINPAAKTHVLIIPNAHIESVGGIEPEDKDLIGRIFLAAKLIAEKEKIDETGFRVLVNSGSDAGQIIGHLHFHLLGGEKLKAI